MTRLKRSLAVAATLLAATLHCLGGAGVVLPDREYIVTHWQVEQGLPGNTITAMAQTRDGFLWFGTFGGLVRFDGVNFRVFRPADTPALPDYGIVNLHLDRSGGLWVSTLKGPAYLKEGKWSRFGPDAGWPGSYVRHAAEAPDGRLYFSTFDGRIVEFAGRRFQELPAPPGDRRPYHYTYIDRAGELNAIRSGRWATWTQGRWVEREMPRELARNRVLSFGPARDGALWVMNDDRLWKVDAAGIVARRDIGRTIEGVWALNETPDGDIWISSYRRGLYRIRPDGSLRVMETQAGIPGERFRFAQPDRNGTIWIGTSGDGLLRCREPRFKSHALDEARPSFAVRSIAKAPQDALLVATFGGGVYAVSGGTPPARVPGTASLYTQAVLHDRRGRIWVGSLDAGLHLVEGGQARRLPAAQSGGGTVRALFQDSAGHIWIAGDRNIVRFDGNAFTPFPLPQPDSGGAILTFFEDLQTRVLWAAGDAGLYRFDGSGFAEVRDPSGASMPAIASMRIDSGGRMWLGTAERGILHYHNGRLTPIDAQAGFIPVRVAGMTAARGDLWFGTGQGVWRARESEAIDYVEGRLKEINWQWFDLFDGLPSKLCSKGDQPVVLGDDGRIWVATDRGLASVDPARLSAPVPAAPVQIESFSYLDEAQKTHSPAIDRKGSFQLPPGSRNIRATLTSVDLIDPEKVLFHYTLRLNEQVVSEGRTGESTLFFPYLTPGGYRLDVNARNSDGVWSPSPVSQRFQVEPAFLERADVRAVLLLLGLGLVGGIVWWIGRQRLRREQQARAREIEMNEIRQRSALVLEITSDAVWFESPARKITFMNNAARGMFGLAQESDVSIASTSDLLREPVITEEAFPAVYRTGTWENNVSIQNGARALWLRLTAHRTPDGDLEFISARARDVTELKAAEEALKTSEEKFSKAFHATPDALVILDVAEGVIVEVNEGFERTFGVDASRAMGRTVVDLGLLGSPDSGRRFLDELAATGRIVDREYPFTRLDGRVSTALVRAERFYVGGRQLILAVFHDLTNRIEMEEQVRQAQKMDSVGRLAGGIAHDFNNLLTVINGYSQFLAQSVPPDQPAHKMVEEIGKAGERAAGLTRQLLAFSRSQVLQPRPVDVNELIRDNAVMLSRLLREDIRLDIRPLAGSATVMADPTQIHQVLINLAVNARDAMPDGGLLSIATRDGSPPGVLFLTVTDTGAGMTDEVRRRAFDPFFTTKPEGQGTGLGLSTVYGIVRQCGGWINIESQVGVGTTMTVGLHTVAPMSEAEALGKPDQQALTGTETVLVVEDQGDVRAMVTSILSGLGYHTLSAAGGHDAIAVATAHDGPIHLLLTDVVMPHMSGKEAARRIHEGRPGTRVLYMSGYTEESLLNGGRLDPGTAVIAKPFGPDDLAKKIREVLAG